MTAKMIVYGLLGMAGLLVLAGWISGGEEALHQIEQPVDVPEGF
jgi:hypothetical protein